jgi:hypothetical protein
VMFMVFPFKLSCPTIVSSGSRKCRFTPIRPGRRARLNWR